MIAVDTNLLVYAHREDSPWHDAALTKITELAEAKSPWSIPWPCIHEFLAIVTNRAYAWSYKTDDGETRYVAILGVPPINSALNAVQAYIVAEAKKQK